MRRITTLLGIVATYLTLANASYAQVSKVELGAEGGPAMTAMRGQELVDDYSKFTIGPMAGITAQFNLNEVVSIRTGISYAKKGVKYDVPRSTYGINYAYHMKEEIQYISLPVLLRFHFTENRTFFINAGGYLSYMFESRRLINSTEYGPYADLEMTGYNAIAGDYVRMDAGVSIGAGVNFPICDALNFTAEIREDLSLMNIADDEIVEAGELRNSALGLLLGLSFNL